MSAPVVGLLLAAGGSRRLGQPKQLLRMDGEPLVRVMARRLLKGGCARVLVMLGANAEDVREALAPLIADTMPDGPQVNTLHHPAWTDGMGTTISAGVAAIQRDVSIAGVLIAACDMPSVTSAHVGALLATAQNAGPLRRCASTYRDASRTEQGEMLTGVPAVFPRRDFPALIQLRGDRGARALIAPSDPRVPLADGVLDLDTPDAVQRWRDAQVPSP